jgi:hypothetical protein
LWLAPIAPATDSGQIIDAALRMLNELGDDEGLSMRATVVF